MRKPIVVVGSINMDLVALAPRIPIAGETLIGSGFETTPGGKGANQAVAVARLGYPVAMIGCVGEDVFGTSVRANLNRAGVDTSAVTQVSGPSGVAQIQVDDKGQNSIIVVPGANRRLDPHLVERNAAAIRAAGAVLCQLEIPMDTIARTLEICAEANVPVVLDPAPAAVLHDNFWPQITWFTPNETEAAFYAGSCEDPQDTADRLLAKGAKGIVLKRGSEGVFLTATGQAATEQAGTRIPPFAVRAVDSVAAGDCFNGAFAVGLLEERAPADAARFASAAAAISVTRRGAQASMPTRAEVERLLAGSSES